jgi:DNA (cytosine-5)-methyltransferase 1
MSKNVGDTKKLKNVISFCTGYGGIERGLSLAGINHRVVACVEIEAYVIANLVQKMESNQMAPAPVWTNVKTFPGKGFREKVDILTGGYPCQPFSVAGHQLGTEDPRHLWPFILQQIQTIRPVQCFFENVEGHINRGLEQVISDLESAGYDATWGIFSAAEVGAPHQRKRVFILGNSKHYGSPRSKKSKDNLPASDNGSERSKTTVKSSRASKSSGSENLSDCEPSDSSSKRLQGSSQAGNTCQEESESFDQQLARCREAFKRQWLSEPRLDRVVDGCPHRIDRTRLLGNGVVPQQAAFAYTKLSERIS